MSRILGCPAKHFLITEHKNKASCPEDRSGILDSQLWWNIFEFESWNPNFDRPLQAWQSHGVIAPHAKPLELVTLATGVVILHVAVNSHWAVFSADIVVMSCVAVFIAKRPGLQLDRPSL